MNKKDVDTFEKLQSQLEGLHAEVSALSKKSQNDALNKFKLGFVNQILDESNMLLGEKYKPFTNFANFAEDDLPTNSDVTLILSQYLTCFEKLRADNVVQEFTTWYWKIEGKQSDIKTTMPKRIRER